MAGHASGPGAGHAVVIRTANALLFFSPSPSDLHRRQRDDLRRRSAAIHRRPLPLPPPPPVAPSPRAPSSSPSRAVLRLAVAATKERVTGRRSRRGRGDQGVNQRKEGGLRSPGRRRTTMSSLGTSKGILEIAKFGVYVSVPVALTYLVATDSKTLKKLMGLRPYVVYPPEGPRPPPPEELRERAREIARKRQQS